MEGLDGEEEIEEAAQDEIEKNHSLGNNRQAW